MSMGISRRSFLKAGLFTGAAAASGVLWPRTSRSASGAQLCTLFDLSKCIGCEACVVACRDINAAKFPEREGPIPVLYPQSRVKIADWSAPEKRNVRHRLTPYNWLFIQTARGQYNGEPFELNIPRRCMHCHNAPCVNLCPFGAVFTQYNGIVRIHPDVCMGGAKCKAACPWNIPERQSGVGSYLNILPNYAGNGVMFKCDRCYDRVALGELPACIEACPKEVQTIGPRPEIIKKAHQLAQAKAGFIYGEIENGGTNTLYVSPIPFDILNRAIEKEPGQPHLRHVDAAMSTAGLLTSLLVAGPIVGAVAAAARRKRSGDTSSEQGG
jgi:Fe-S-cluster-containing dehydrogenase component